MAFKIQANPTFKINVAIPTPGEKAQILSVTFRHKRKKEVTSWLAAANAAGDQASLLEVIADWDYPGGVTPETVDELLESYPGAGLALYRGYLDELNGAERKN